MTPEGELKKALKKYYKEHGIYHTVVPGGAYGKNGAPDIILCYKGLFIAVEAKVDTEQSGWQELRQKQIERAGGIYAIIKSVKEMDELITSLTPL
jgi:Holliday junction resolvase